MLGKREYSKALPAGSYRKALETAKNLLTLSLSVENITQATGLSKEEVEALTIDYCTFNLTARDAKMICF